MKHITLCLDYDGSVCVQDVTEYHNLDLSVIHYNKQLWAFIELICKKNPDLKTLTLAHFSGRQNFLTDYFASLTNGSESYFSAMKKIEVHLTGLLKTISPSVKVELNCLLMPDIYFNEEHGFVYKTIVENIAHSQAAGSLVMKHPDYNFSLDEFKKSFIFAYVHAIAADAFYILDDRLDILSAINEFYNNDLGKSFIPKGTIVNLLNYDEGKFQASFSAIFEGSGQPCSHYSQILRDAHKKCPAAFPDLETFSQIYKNHMGIAAPLKLFDHPNSDPAENANILANAYVTSDVVSAINTKADLSIVGITLTSAEVEMKLTQPVKGLGSTW